MILIIEGADLVGKTTLVSRLSEITKIPSTSIWIELENPKLSVISVSKTLRLVLSKINIDIIFDRFFFSEYVYGKVLNRDVSYIHDLLAEWKDVPNIHLVILTAKEDVLRKRFNNRGDKYFKLSQIVNFNKEYEAFSKITSRYIKTSIIESVDGDINATALKILDRVNLKMLI